MREEMGDNWAKVKNLSNMFDCNCSRIWIHELSPCGGFSILYFEFCAVLQALPVSYMMTSLQMML